MTKAQERAVKRIRENVLQWDQDWYIKRGHDCELFCMGLTDDSYETLTVKAGNVYVTTHTGWINPHGVAIMKFRHFAIRKGGMICAFGKRPNGRKQVLFTRWNEVLHFGYESEMNFSEEFVRSDLQTNRDWNNYLLDENGGN